MIKILYLSLVSLSFSFLTTASVYAQEDWRYEDVVYDENIKTVQLYPTLAGERDIAERTIVPPIISLRENQVLSLEFDDLSTEFQNFRVKIYHCNFDWTRSVLNDIEFTHEANNYPITEFERSYSTKIPYVHYSFWVPKLKLSGNYLLVIFDRNTSNAVASRRFMVYEPLIAITASARYSQGIQEQRTDQQIDFEINYGNYELVAPQTDLKVIIRQNFRWDQSKTGFQPTSVDPFQKKLSYQFFDLENTFNGGNEFRYFDSRSLGGRGFGVAELDRSDGYTRLILAADEPRNDNFLQMDDLNGQYFIESKEGSNSSVEADYTPVLFSLKTEYLPDEKLFVNGAFNYWQQNETNLLTYEESTGAYHATILLKQGVYNFDYGLVKPDGTLDEKSIEGSYGDTENDYDLLIYHRRPASRYDALIAYRTVEWNRRR